MTITELPTSASNVEHPSVAGGLVEHAVQRLLYTAESGEIADAGSAVEQRIRVLLAEASRGDDEAWRELHSVLYRINLADIACPWQHDGYNAGHALFRRLRDIIEATWLDDDAARRILEISAVPTDTASFVPYVKAVIQEHRSGVSHPLFTFLKDEATRTQLREFHFQESPLDVVFADLLCLMMAGLPGPLRQELAANLWDEVGNGDLRRAHRSLRDRMTLSLFLSPKAYHESPEVFAREELALANLYYRCALRREALVEGIGMMLATEMAVPGRIECQLEGCLRVGMAPHNVHYLAEHVTVDVGHAESWLSAVVLPIVQERPEAATDIMLGVWRRLEHAALVCDRMHDHLRQLVS